MPLGDMMRTQLAQRGLTKPDGFNPYAAGSKMYGLSGRSNATSGPLNSTEAQRGYAQRDRETQARKAAVLQRMQAAQSGNYMSPEYLRGIR